MSTRSTTPMTPSTSCTPTRCSSTSPTRSPPFARCTGCWHPAARWRVRDSDYGGFVWSPADARLTRWLELYHQVTERNGADADAGRHLGAWVRAAGFADVELATSTWTFADPQSRAWWGGLWAERVEQSAFATQAVEYGLSDSDELATLAEGWRAWADDPDGFFVVLHTEVLAQVS